MGSSASSNSRRVQFDRNGEPGYDFVQNGQPNSPRHSSLERRRSPVPDRLERSLTEEDSFDRGSPRMVSHSRESTFSLGQAIQQRANGRDSTQIANGLLEQRIKKPRAVAFNIPNEEYEYEGEHWEEGYGDEEEPMEVAQPRVAKWDPRQGQYRQVRNGGGVRKPNMSDELWDNNYYPDDQFTYHLTPSTRDDDRLDRRTFNGGQSRSPRTSVPSYSRYNGDYDDRRPITSRGRQTGSLQNMPSHVTDSLQSVDNSTTYSDVTPARATGFRFGARRAPPTRASHPPDRESSSLTGSNASMDNGPAPRDFRRDPGRRNVRSTNRINPPPNFYQQYNHGMNRVANTRQSRPRFQ